MLLGYVRPDARHSEAAQTRVLVAFGVSDKKIWAESARERDDEYPVRDRLVRAIRKGAKDVVVVSDFHRLASTRDDLKGAIRAIHKAGAVIAEASTGRRSDGGPDLADMALEAADVYAGRGLSKEAASRMGKLGAKASPATKPKSGHMPLHDIQAIMNDQSLDVTEAVEKIRRDRRYKVKVSMTTIYRWAKRGKLKLLPRLSGRKPKN